MTRTRSSRAVSNDFWRGRMDNARSVRESARTLFELSGPGDNTNPVIAQVVNAVIAYGDALTAQRGGKINQEDHQRLGALLRSTLGNRLPDKQLKHVSAVLGWKDAASYGARAGTREQAEQLLARLDEFATWAEAELAR